MGRLSEGIPEEPKNRFVRRIIKLAIWLAVLFLILLLLFFSFRTTLLDKAVSRIIQKAQERKGLVIVVVERKFESFFNVSFSDISVSSPTGDTLLTIDSVYLSPRIWPIIQGDLEFATLDVFKPYLTIYKTAERDNVSFLFKEDTEEQNTESKAGLANTMDKLFDLFFNQVPDQMQVNEFGLNAHLKDKEIRVHMPEASIHDNSINAVIELPSDSFPSTYSFTGNVDRSDHTIEGALYSISKQQLIPVLKEYYNLALKSDTFQFYIKELPGNNGQFVIQGSIACKGFYAENWRLAPEPVIVEKAQLNYDLVFSGDSIYLDSTSTIRLNDLIIKPYLSVVRGKNKIYTMHVSIPETPADSFFSSLPMGIFEHTRGIKAKGELSYRMYFRYDEENPDSLKFSSRLTKNDFSIQSFGKTDPRKMNGEFTYTAYEKGRALRSFPVGPSHSSFTPLEGISPYLVSSVMTSEDGNFYYHHGFNEDAFRKSIIENIREKRFKRGGSTISMQLMKNVFLTRNKNISRKIEEAMLTWLTESNRLVSKERMIEVYLNIIEWGPGVYGIGEASHFYFDKIPSELTLNESIFLAMIVPQPKGFRYHFDEQAHLKPHCQAYYNLLAKHLVKKEVITEEQQANLLADVTLTGPASKLIKTVPDSMRVEEPELPEFQLKME